MAFIFVCALLSATEFAEQAKSIQNRQFFFVHNLYHYLSRIYMHI